MAAGNEIERSVTETTSRTKVAKGYTGVLVNAAPAGALAGPLIDARRSHGEAHAMLGHVASQLTTSLPEHQLYCQAEHGDRKHAPDPKCREPQQPREGAAAVQW
jgi:hypothetical protein